MIRLGVLGGSVNVAEAGGWTPADLPNVQFWYDADDASTITSSGGLVSQWNDKSGNARHLTQATSGSRPSTGTRTLNGRNVIDHDGTGKNLANTGWTFTRTEYTAVIVAEVDSKTSWNLFTSSWQDLAWIRGSSGGGTLPHNRMDFGGYTPTVSVDGTTLSPMTSGAMHTAAGSGPILAVGLGAPNTNGQSFATSIATSTWALDGGVAEILLVLGTISGGDMTSLTSYLSSKWGV